MIPKVKTQMFDENILRLKISTINDIMEAVFRT